MAKWMTASLVAMIALSGAAHGQTPPVASQAETTVSDVTVVGGKIAPTTEDPMSATCEFLVASDPFVRAQMAAAAGDPLMGPRFYQPTRFPRNVDWNAAPTSAPGSALPNIGRQYRGVTIRPANGADTAAGAVLEGNTAEPAASSLEFDPAGATSAPAEFTTDNAVSACRDMYSTGASPDRGAANASQSPIFAAPWLARKTEIAYRDKTLPTALALFEEHRYAESLDYFQRAFKKLAYGMGGEEAALMIGKLYLGAPGVEPDARKAIGWLTRAAGSRFNPVTDMPQFDPLEPGRNTAIGEASMLLARIYQVGIRGVAKDPAQSRKWFARAFEVGHVPAAAVLADIHYYGVDTPADAAMAFRYYKKGATLRHAPAQERLAEMYQTGDAPGGRNMKLALGWHNEAAKIGHASSLLALAMASETGEGVAKDPQRALSLYKLAAMAGSAPARNILGLYFYEGRGLEKDHTVARRWFEQAAAAGDADAMFNLGAMLMKGEGGEVDRARAWVLLTIAGRGQHEQAASAVRGLETRMTAEEKAAAAKLLSPNA